MRLDDDDELDDDVSLAADPVEADDVRVTVRKRGHVGKRLAFWLMFGVILGVLPISVEALQSLMSTGGISAMSLLADGRLLISNTAIAAAAIGEVLYVAFQEGSQFGTLKQVISGFSAFMCLNCCLLSTVAYINVPTSSARVVTDVSLILFMITLGASLACVALAATR